MSSLLQQKKSDLLKTHSRTKALNNNALLDKFCSYRSSILYQRDQDIRVSSSKYSLIEFNPLYLKGLANACSDKQPSIEVNGLTFQQLESFQFKQIKGSEVVIFHLETLHSENCLEQNDKIIQIQKLLKVCSKLEIPLLVITDNIFSLARFKLEIINSHCGFGACDKSASIKEILRSIEIIKYGGLFWPKKLKESPILEPLEPILQRLLNLKFENGLSDIQIAETLAVTPRTLRNYWVQLQDIFEISKDADLVLSVQIMKAAQKHGFII